ncbi:proton-conducting transporter transmembrane domain-containing protein [Thermococcus sp.]
MNYVPFLVSMLLPFVLLVVWKSESRGVGWFAAAIFGISLAFNAWGAYQYLTEYYGKVMHISYASYGTTGEIFGLIVDEVSVLIGLVTMIVAFLVSLYAIDYMSEKHVETPLEKGRGKFFALLGVLVASTMVFIYGTNLVQFIVALEIIALALDDLINTYGNASYDSLKAYLVLNLAVVLMMGAFFILGSGQALYKLSGAGLSAKHTSLILIAFAAFAMSSQFFFYSWLPKSTKGPAPVSALVHSVSVVSLGILLMLRFIQFTGAYEGLFYILAVFSVLMVVLMMLYYPIQSDLKTLIAYSTIGQAAIGFMTLAYAAYGSPIGLQVATYQVINHAFVKALAFLTAGAMGYSLGTTNMKRIRGFAKSLPAVSVSWFLAMFGLAGVLPLGMFFSKAYETMTNAHAPGVFSWLLPILILFEAAILMVVVMVWFRRMFFGEEITPHPAVSPTELMYIAMFVLIIAGTVSPWVTLSLVSKIGFIAG